ncbi:MAG: MATE family efflux transporter [Eubacteriales bacterium]|nr:MATE family efflux transporter [Eubacteriales bacterium]
MKQSKRIQLSDHFTYGRLLRFVASPVLMMICTSLYSIVDGFFVSNFVGKTPFAAVNLIMPVTMGIGTVGFMVGTGGSAVVSKALGEGRRDRANEYFSMLVYLSAAAGILLSAAAFVFTPQIARALGAEGELLRDCVVYGRILFAGETAFILQCEFQSFFSAAEKPGLSLKISLLSGMTNVVLDFLFIAVLGYGLAGAAAATVMGQLVGGIAPLFYFAGKNDSLLRLGRTRIYGRTLALSCANGASEMVSNLSMSVVNILYNFQLMRMVGENGVAAYGIIMYVNFVFTAIFFGYAIGSSPIVSFHYGAGNESELQNLFCKSAALVCAVGVIMVALAEALAGPMAELFAGYDRELFEMTCRGFRLYSLSFFMMGINIWGSAFFTALNNGAVSAAISFLRTLLFQLAAVAVLPALLGIDGVWLAIVAAELAALLVTGAFFAAQRKNYRYA